MKTERGHVNATNTETDGSCSCVQYGAVSGGNFNMHRKSDDWYEKYGGNSDN